MLSRFSKNLGKLMQLRNLNQVELSRISGVAQTLISSYLRESAKAKYPSLPNLVALMEALQCRFEDLIDITNSGHLCKEGRQEVPTREQVALWTAFKQLPDGHWLKIMIKQELLNSTNSK